jgi:hypothetical protein
LPPNNLAQIFVLLLLAASVKRLRRGLRGALRNFRS